MVNVAQNSRNDAMFQQALALHSGGRIAQAQALYQDILKTNPRHAPTLHHLGIALWQQGQAQKALPYVRKAIKEAPSDFAAHNTMGLIQTSLHNDGDAEKSFMAALSINPDYAEAHFNYGRLLCLQGNWAGVLAAMDALLAINPDHALGRLLNVAALAHKGRFNDVAALKDSAFSNMPQTAFSYYLKGQICFLLLDMDDALAAYNEALTRDPSMAAALCGKAGVLAETGDNDAAKVCLHQALDLNPSYTAALYQLVGLHKCVEGDPVHKRLKDADRHKSGMIPKQKGELYYSWAKFYKDAGDLDKTFEGWRRGAQAEHDAAPYDHGKTLDQFSSVKRIYSALEDCDFDVQVVDSGFTPVFIVGMPRSGTSLLEQILAAHPRITGGGEMRFFRQALGPLETLEKLTDNPHELAAQLQRTGQDYCRWAKDWAGDATFVTDKMPYNFRYIGLIKQMMPQAKILHIQRHPMDTCLSCFSILFHEGQEWSYDLDDLACYYNTYYETVSFWREVLPAGSFLDIRYEVLARDMEHQARCILDYCGLDWDKACLDFHTSKRAIRTASTQQVRQPLYTSSIRRWKAYESQFAPLAAALVPVVEGLGYEL